MPTVAPGSRECLQLRQVRDILQLTAADINGCHAVVGIQGVVTLPLLFRQRLGLGRPDIAQVYVPAHLVRGIELAGMKSEIGEEENITWSHRQGDWLAPLFHVLERAYLPIRTAFALQKTPAVAARHDVEAAIALVHID